MVVVVNQVVAYALTDHTIPSHMNIFTGSHYKSNATSVKQHFAVAASEFFATKKDYWYSVLIYPQVKIRLRVDFFPFSNSIIYIAPQLTTNNL